MQSDSGLLRWLNVPFVYNAFSAAVGANALRRRLIQNHVRAKPGDKVIDIGCGSALAFNGFRRSSISGSTSVQIVSHLPGEHTAPKELS